MERYLGMDVHKDSCSFCVLDASGRQVRQDIVETNGQALVGYLQQQAGQLHLCLEEGEWSAWLWEILSPCVAELVVTRGERRKGSKSDRLDARALAERLRTGQVTQRIFKAPNRYARLRELASVYGLLVRDLVRAKNRLRSRFRRRGIQFKGDELYQPEGRKKRLRELPAAMRPAVELLGEDLDHVQMLKARAEEVLVEESRRHKTAALLETIPGLGPVRVAQILPIVITPHRFRTKRQFWSYCGFGVVTHSSSDFLRVDGRWVRGQVPRTRGLNRNRNQTLKRIFKGAATTVISSMGPNPFRTVYERLCDQGTRPNLAKVTVARKLAATTLAIWKSQEVYDPER